MTCDDQIMEFSTEVGIIKMHVRRVDCGKRNIFLLSQKYVGHGGALGNYLDEAIGRVCESFQDAAEENCYFRVIQNGGGKSFHPYDNDVLLPTEEQCVGIKDALNVPEDDVPVQD